MSESFTLEIESKQYNCTRTITGASVLTQTIRVSGIGSKADSANYGPKDHPPSTMAGVARLIAHEIIRDTKT